MLPATQSLDTEGYVSKKMVNRIDACIKYIITCGKKALGDAGLKWDGPEIKVGTWLVGKACDRSFQRCSLELPQCTCCVGLCWLAPLNGRDSTDLDCSDS